MSCVRVKWNPPLTEEDALKRTYRTLGWKTLDPNEEWTDVTDESDLDAAVAASSR